MSAHAGYYRQPALSGDTIVFVCEDDLWSVPAEGGIARRLTASAGRVGFPRFSPDGRRLAYTATDDGPAEIYVMDALGGAGERRTWTGGRVRTSGWTPDGKDVVFATNAAQPFASSFSLHAVPAAGGRTRALPFGRAQEIAWAPGAKARGVVLAVNSGDPARWKRYRGGTAGQLWIDRDGDGTFEPLVELAGNLASPMWIGRRVYFLSDHEGHGNLYSCTPAGRGLKRHTDHEDYYVRFPTTDGRRIAYHAGADLYLYDPRADEARGLDVRVHSAQPARQRRFVSAPKTLEGADLGPRGAQLACVARGGLFTMALWEGAPERHGAVSSARYRLPRWLPDGKHVVAVHDEEGEEGLVCFPGGGGRVRRIRGDFGRILTLAAAPAGPDRVALTNHRQELWVVDVKTGKKKRLDASKHDRITGASWSPDARWLAYSFAPDMRTRVIRLCDVRTGKTRDATPPEFLDESPAFDPEGRYLYFLSRRAFDPVYDSHVFDLGFPRGVQPCLVPLARNTPSPFDSAARPAKPLVSPNDGDDSGDDGDDDGKKKKRKGPEPVRIDFAGLAGRVVSFPVPEARYGTLAAARGERVFFTTHPVRGSIDDRMDDRPSRTHLHAFDVGKLKLRSFGTIEDFSLSVDRRALLIRAEDGLRALSAGTNPKDLPDDDKPRRETGWLDLRRVRVAVQPGDEWRQMFREAWRLQRDQFWTEDMAAVDWQDVHDRYLPLVDRVASRAEFSDLVWEMQGELGTSHCYEMGGDYEPGRRWHQGFLGADIAYEARTQSWKVRRIPEGDSWRRGATSPLRAPAVDVREGDVILEVNGRPVGPERTPFECLVNLAGRDVGLTVRHGKTRRRVAVRTLRSERPLRYRDWVRANRERVHEETRGKVGYVHVPDMGPNGYAEFHRSFRREVDRDGLIIDVRWNGGGHVSALLLEKLMRRRVGYDLSRWQGLMPYPAEAPMGPMVALTNEHAGSDGDIFSHCFKLYGLGPLIGKRTWGGVVGIFPRHALVDGTVTTQPEFSFWFEDVGFDVENYGTDPDIEVDWPPHEQAKGKDPQLERGLEEIRRILKEDPPKKPSLKKRPQRTAPKLPKR